MTKKQKLRQNSFTADFNGREDDLILADLDVMLEDEPSPVPLNHFFDDEETIDRLLINSGFNQFVIEPLKQAEKNQQVEVEENAASDFYLMADFDEIADEEDAIDRLLVNAGFDDTINQERVDGKPDAWVIDDISRVNSCDIHFEERGAMVADAGVFDNEESELSLDKDAGLASLRADKSEQESIKKQINEYFEDQNSIATDTGITALSSVRSEQNATKKQINDYEHKIKKAAIITYTSLSFASIALLSTVAMGVIVSSMQTKISKLTELVSILEEDMSNIVGKNSDLEINNSDPSVEQLNQKTNGLPEQIEEQTQPRPDISENVKTEVVTKQTTDNKANDEQQNKTPVLKNKKSSEASLNKVLAEKKGNTTQPATSWSVNLNAYEDQRYAKSKAEKFIQNGIPVKVIAVNMNNARWYRLKVGGFKNEEEATSYAAKIKKSLNLNTVFVGKN